MYCEHCGAPVPDYSKFCEQCGKPLTGRVSPPPAAVPVPAPWFSGSHRKPRTFRPLTKPQYSRIAFWIRSRCSRIRPGMDVMQVRKELEQVYQGEKARGISEEFLLGLRYYIEDQRYDNLLR